MPPAASETLASGRGDRLALGALLLIVLAVGLVTMPAEVYEGDPSSVRMEAALLISGHGLGVSNRLMKTPAFRSVADKRYFVRNKSTGRWFCRYGLANTLLAIPPLLVEQQLHGRLVPGRVKSSTLPLVLNLYNLIFALLIAYTLWRILSLYTTRDLAKGLFILSAFYATFLWNYLRAHNSEIHQLFFYLAFHYQLLRFVHGHGKGARPLAAAACFLGLLCLTKLVFILLVPVLCLAAPLSRVDRAEGLVRGLREEIVRNRREYARWLLAPAAAVVLLTAGVNVFKFGSPLSTGYFLQTGESAVPEHFFTGFWGFLIGPQRSVFVHFPILLFAAFGARRFYRKHPFDLVLTTSIFALFFLLISLFYWAWRGDWAGEWGYGPRYLLFVLPCLSLPFLELLPGSTRSPARHPLRPWLGLAAMAPLLLYSTYLQTRVNALSFFAYYQARDVLSRVDHPEIHAYFRNRHFGLFNADWIAYRRGVRPFVPLELAKQRVGRKGIRTFERELGRRIRPNYWLTRPEAGPRR